MSDLTAIPFNYQTEGGALQIDAPTYVQRKADEDLYQGLKASKLCYVLNARQMGKSSLKVRTIQRLQKEGIACAAVDLQGIGTSATEEQWYVGIISRIARPLQLHRQFNVNSWWIQHQLLSCVQRFTLFLETVLLPAIPQPIVIFIDEVDLTLSLPFSGDDFFGALRECYNRRADEPDYRRLTFALLGVATPSELIRKKQTAPFNIGQPIDLTGFQLHEAQPLLPGLVAKASNPQVLLDTVLDWTGGQPFLTQKVCQLLLTADSAPIEGQEAEWVAQIVRNKIIENWEAQDTPQHLKTIRDRLLHSEERTGRLLGLYQQLLQEEVAADDSPEQMEIRLSGLVVQRGGRLQVYNQIYQAVFNLDWVNSMLASLRPYAESLEAWLKSDCQDESRLLRGQALKDAQTWASGKKLSDQDYQYLSASQELDKRAVQAALEAEKEANQLLVDAQKKAKRRINIGSAILAIFLLGAFAAMATASKAKQERDFAKADLSLTQKEKSTLESEAKNAKAETARAQDALLGAQKTTRSVNLQLASSKLRLAHVTVEALRAQKTTRSVNLQLASSKLQLAHVTVEARRQIADITQRVRVARTAAEQADQDRLFAEAKAQIAQKVLVQALEARRQAEEGAKLERQVIATLRQFGSGAEISALLSAMEGGQSLKTLVGRNDTLNNYPTVGPLFALQTVLDGIRLQNQFESADDRSEIFSVSFSSDGQFLASAGEDGTIHLGDLSGKEQKRFEGHKGSVRSISFSPNQELLASAGSDGTVRLWNLSGSQKALLEGHQGWVSSLAFSPDGKLLGTSGKDDTIRLWKPSGEKFRDWQGHQDGIDGLDWSPDGERIATAGKDGTVHLWNLSGDLIKSWQAHQGRVRAIKFNPKSGSQNLVTVGDDSSVRIWNWAGEKQNEWLGHRGGVRSVNFSPDGNYIVTGGNDSLGRLWSTDGKQLAEFRGQLGQVNSIAFSPDNQHIATGGEDGKVRLWNFSGQQLTKFRNSPGDPLGEVKSVRFSPDGQYLVTAEENSLVRLWDLSGQQRSRFDHQSEVGFTAKEQALIAFGKDGTVRTWNLSGNPIAELIKDYTAQIVNFSVDGKRLISVGVDGLVQVWDLNRKQVTQIAKFQGYPDVISVSSSLDGKYIALGRSNGIAGLWSLSGQELGHWDTHHGEIKSMAFHPREQRLATAGRDGIVRFWNFSGKELYRLEGHQGSIYSLSFSSDGQRLASAGEDGIVRLWAVSSAQQLAQLDVFQYFDHAWIRSVSFSPDNQSLALAIAFREGTMPTESTVWVWRTSDLTGLLSRGCNWLQYYLSSHSGLEGRCPK